MDRLTKKQRSWNMSRIRASGTEFEKQIFKKLRKRDINFQKNYSKIIGKPDIAKPKYKKVIFLHSDFWHGWQLPRWEKILPSDFWKKKMRNNRKRDALVAKELRRRGWKVMIVWEHSFKKNPDIWIDRMTEFLE